MSYDCSDFRYNCISVIDMMSKIGGKPRFQPKQARPYCEPKLNQNLQNTSRNQLLGFPNITNKTENFVVTCSVNRC